MNEVDNDAAEEPNNEESDYGLDCLEESIRETDSEQKNVDTENEEQTPIIAEVTREMQYSIRIHILSIQLDNNP